MKRLLFILFFIPALTQAQIITTFAGNGSTTHLGDGGLATVAGIAYNVSGVFDKYGNYYFSEVTNGNRICKIDTNGIITTIAGTGPSAYGGDGGPATAAKLFGPEGIALDTIGNIFFAESQDGRIRKIDIATGIITTIAGNGTNGYSGDGIPATSAMLNDPWDICFDKHGNLYIADNFNSRVRRVDTNGIITTVAGNGIGGYTSDGGRADTTRISVFGVCIDKTGNLYFADDVTGRIRKVDTAGIISTFAGTGIAGNSGDGGPALGAQIAPLFIRIDKYGSIYIAQNYLVNKVRMIDTTGIINTFAGSDSTGFSGDDGPATAAKLNKPEGIAFDACNNVYIADDFNHRIRKVTVDTSCSLDHGTLNVKTIVSTIGIKLYPSPTTSSLTISSPNKITQLTITNLLGQTVCIHEYNSEKVQVDVANLPAGMYLLKINGTEVRKFVKE